MRPDTAVGIVDKDNASEFDAAPTVEQIRLQEQESANVMFLIEKVKFFQKGSDKQGAAGTTYWDIGGNGTVIRNGYAEQLGLEGTPVMQEMVRTGGDLVKWYTKAYNLRARDSTGKMRVMLALGVNKISTPIGEVDTSGVKDLFPGVVGLGRLTRPHGEIDVMVGMNYLELLPKEILRTKGLGLWSSQFGETMLVGGTHPTLYVQQPERLTPEAENVRLAVSHAVYAVPDSSIRSHHTHVGLTFLEEEELGVHQPRRCDRCKTCGACSAQAQHMTRVESKELAMIKASMKFVKEDPGDEGGVIRFHYPAKGDLTQLKDNRAQAIGFQKGVAKKQTKEERAAFNKEVHDYISRGTFRHITPQEMESWTGVVNYVTIHGVPKPESKSTALRLVSNSSLRNKMSQGVSYNDLLVKGPNGLQPLVQVQIDFRTLHQVVIWDYKKAYNSVHTGEEELHARRIVHRDNDDEEWQTLGIDRMHFGDKCAATGLEVGKEMTADKGEDVFPETVKQLKRGYIDDGLGGGSREMVDRLIGEEKQEKALRTWQYGGTVAQIMKRGNFHVKFMINKPTWCTIAAQFNKFQHNC